MDDEKIIDKNFVRSDQAPAAENSKNRDPKELRPLEIGDDLNLENNFSPQS